MKNKISKKLERIYKKHFKIWVVGLPLLTVRRIITYFTVESKNNNILYLSVSLPYFRNKQTNWGDDISLIITELLSKRKVIPYRHSFSKGINYLCIGSIINLYSNKDSIIWGSGVMSDKNLMKNIPKQVLAVRGPLSRNFLLSKNIECPEIYGDPALLFPYLYKPNIKKTYKLGIICHHLDIKNRTFIKKLEGLLSENIILIDIVNYGKWTDFIDKVVACEKIMSSSLHGIIISDAYGIPNIWVSFTGDVGGNGYKFNDYFLSVNKDISKPFNFSFEKTPDFYLSLISSWTAPCSDLKPLVKCCPFIDSEVQKYLLKEL